jgi:hypothetical protein
MTKKRVLEQFILRFLSFGTYFIDIILIMNYSDFYTLSNRFILICCLAIQMSRNCLHKIVAFVVSYLP